MRIKMTKTKLKNILKEHIIEPIECLRQRGNYYLTEKGYNTLIDNTVEEIMKEIKNDY